MGNSENDFFQKISREIMRWDYLVKDQKTYESLERLANSTVAKMAWLELSKKAINRLDEYPRDVFYVAGEIGRWSIEAHLDESQKLTEKELSQLFSKAQNLAAELRNLILQNSRLRFYGRDLIPDIEAAAYSRILRGVSAQMVAKLKKHPDDYERIFSQEIEEELDSLQARDFPKFASMTSTDAYKELRWREISDDGFILSLECFEKLVAESTPSPILPRPKKKLADEHVYAMMICDSLNFNYGSPCFEITASFCTAFFDHDFEVDTIKKWWSRKQDTSK